MPKEGRYFKEPENKYAEEWTDSLEDMVAHVASNDARYSVYDAKTGATMRINLDSDEEDSEAFYIFHGDNLYDAFDRDEAVMILRNIRAGRKNPDIPQTRSTAKKLKKQKAGKGSPSGFGGIR